MIRTPDDDERLAAQLEEIRSVGKQCDQPGADQEHLQVLLQQRCQRVVDEAPDDTDALKRLVRLSEVYSEFKCGPAGLVLRPLPASFPMRDDDEGNQ